MRWRTALLLALPLVCGCRSKQSTVADAGTPSSDASRPPFVGSAPFVPTDASTEDASPPPSFDAGIDLMLNGKRILHTGDSMVGGKGGLTKALGEKFKGEGAKYYTISRTSISLAKFDRDPKFVQAIARLQPDIVILTLGANDAFFAKPEYLTPVLHRIVKKIGNRECYWVAPALWKPDQTGYIEELRAQVGPCKFFDSTKVNIARAGDHIHPTDEGGEAWGEAFWEFFKRERAGSARGSP